MTLSRFESEFFPASVNPKYILDLVVVILNFFHKFVGNAAILLKFERLHHLLHLFFTLHVDVLSML